MTKSMSNQTKQSESNNNRMKGVETSEPVKGERYALDLFFDDGQDIDATMARISKTIVDERVGFPVGEEVIFSVKLTASGTRSVINWVFKPAQDQFEQMRQDKEIFKSPGLATKLIVKAMQIVNKRDEKPEEFDSDDLATELVEYFEEVRDTYNRLWE